MNCRPFVSFRFLLCSILLFVSSSSSSSSSISSTFSFTTNSKNENCTLRSLSRNVAPAGLNYNVTGVIANAIPPEADDTSFPSYAWKLLNASSDVVGIVLTRFDKRNIALNIDGRLRLFSDGKQREEEKEEVGTFWRAFETTVGGWGRPFNDCKLMNGSWFYVYVLTRRDVKIGLFVRLELDRCDEQLAELFGDKHRCDATQTCISESGIVPNEFGNYRCVCRPGFYDPYPDWTWKGREYGDFQNNTTRCHPCPSACPFSCAPSGTCHVGQNPYLKTWIIAIQVVCMGFVLLLAIVVFRQRKTKAIATGMWTILEIILLGILILYSTVIVRTLDPSITRCLLEPWIREIGFIICYGAVILKLYRHLIEFRTRKAHRWVVKDTDLLKYLLIMVLSGLTYMAAFTALTLNFAQENYSILTVSRTMTGERFMTCKYLWWDYVTEIGELAILIFGIHLAYASRNARTQFHERNFLCGASSLELAVSLIFYTARIFVLNELHPDVVLIIYCVRSQISQTISLLLIFLPKFWYQQKQDPSSHRSLSGNNSDVEMGEVTIADMNPDDIRAELKRLYMQLETLRAKTMCKDNPHISKRRGGRKAQHRRFSLQKKGSKEKVRRTLSLHSRQKDKGKTRENDTEITEAEPSRTPEESVCSIEGASAIYADLPTTNQIN